MKKRWVTMMTAILWQNGYSNVGFVVSGQIILSVAEIISASGGLFQCRVGAAVLADISASLGIVPEQFTAVRWQAGFKFNINGYKGSFFKSAFPKGDFGILDVCNSGGVIQTEYLNFEVTRSKLYSTWATFPPHSYPTPSLISPRIGGVDVLLQSGYSAVPVSILGDEFGLRLGYPNLLLEAVVEYVCQSSALDSSIGVASLVTTPF
jgi:hypothetical protein